MVTFFSSTVIPSICKSSVPIIKSTCSNESFSPNSKSSFLDFELPSFKHDGYASPIAK